MTAPDVVTSRHAASRAEPDAIACPTGQRGSASLRATSAHAKPLSRPR